MSGKIAPLLATAAACVGDQSEPVSSANLVITNGRIYTIAAAQPFAEAVAISDGKYVYVGGSSGVAQSNLGLSMDYRSLIRIESLAFSTTTTDSDTQEASQRMNLGLQHTPDYGTIAGSPMEV